VNGGALGAGPAVGSVAASAGTGPGSGERKGGRRGLGCWGRGWSSSSCSRSPGAGGRGARRLGAGAVLGSFSPLAAAGKGLTAGQHQISTGIGDPGGRGGRTAACCPGRGLRCPEAGLGSGGRRRTHRGCSLGGWGNGAGWARIAGGADPSRGGGITASRLLAAVGESFAALKSCLTAGCARGCAGHVRPDRRMTTLLRRECNSAVIAHGSRASLCPSQFLSAESLCSAQDELNRANAAE
jgi:hypothetical protein